VTALTQRGPDARSPAYLTAPRVISYPAPMNAQGQALIGSGRGCGLAFACDAAEFVHFGGQLAARDEAGRQREHDTTPGGSSSRPSKNRAICCGVRKVIDGVPTWFQCATASAAQARADHLRERAPLRIRSARACPPNVEKPLTQLLAALQAAPGRAVQGAGCGTATGFRTDRSASGCSEDPVRRTRPRTLPGS
jgi:hypothetical protein